MALIPTISIFPLAQFDDAPPPPPPPQSQPARPMTFSDLQGAMHDYSTGKTNDNNFRNGSLALLALIGVVALLIHLRQRHKDAGPPDSMAKLGRELGRLITFPMGTRWLLKWVALSTNVPFASLLLSSALFDRCVGEWASGNTFAVVRTWGKGRLARLRPSLFEAVEAVVQPTP